MSDQKTNFMSFIYSPSSTNGEHLAKMVGWTLRQLGIVKNKKQQQNTQPPCQAVAAPGRLNYSWRLSQIFLMHEKTRLDAFQMKGLRKIFFCGFRGQQGKQMSGFLTKLE